MDNLFIEGRLVPVEKPEVSIEANPWIRSGIACACDTDEVIRTARLFDLALEAMSHSEAGYSDWLQFAMKWAELGALVHGGSRPDEQERYRQIAGDINHAFAVWLESHYASLITLPPMNLAMLHHVPRRLARDLESSSSARVAPDSTGFCVFDPCQQMRIKTSY